MRGRIVVGLIAAVLLWLSLSLGGVPKPTAEPAPITQPPTLVTVAPSPRPARSLPDRNIFEYGRQARGRALLPAAGGQRAAATAAEARPPEPASRVRLVGLARRSGTLKAVLSLDGQVVVLAPGQQAGDFALLSVDPESGARVRGPDGEQTLELP